MTHALRLDQVRRRYGGKAAVDGASLTLEAGKITCLLGPSGCGKSTLLRLIAGLEPVDSGQIRAQHLLSGPGVHVPPEQRDIGFVFQDYALFPHLTVEDNVGFGLSELSAKDRQDRVAEQLTRVKLQDRAKAFPQALSGGEQQRIALARALVRRPALVLLDEPFSGLDSYLKAEVRDATLAALRAAGTTALIVTHDAEEALIMADALALMRDGQILQTGSPRDCYDHPVSLSAAKLLGPINGLMVQIADQAAPSIFGPIAASGLPNGPAQLIFRPETVQRTPHGIGARVLASRFAGPQTHLTLALDGPQPEPVQILAYFPSDQAPHPGELVTISLDLARATLIPNPK